MVTSSAAINRGGNLGLHRGMISVGSDRLEPFGRIRRTDLTESRTVSQRIKEAERAELHKTIWRIANDLRGSVDGWDFKSYVLGMLFYRCLLYTSPSPRDRTRSRMPSSA